MLPLVCLPPPRYTSCLVGLPDQGRGRFRGARPHLRLLAPDPKAPACCLQGAPGKGADEEVRQRYLSPSFKFK